MEQYCNTAELSEKRVCEFCKCYLRFMWTENELPPEPIFHTKGFSVPRKYKPTYFHGKTGKKSIVILYLNAYIVEYDLVPCELVRAHS